MDTMDWVWNRKTDLSLHERVVYAALLTYRRRDQPREPVWPSTEAIAQRAEVSRRTVVRTLPTLAAKGLIEITHRRRPGTARNDSNLYVVNAPERRPKRLTRRAEPESENPQAVRLTDTRAVTPGHKGGDWEAQESLPRSLAKNPLRAPLRDARAPDAEAFDRCIAPPSVDDAPSARADDDDDETVRDVGSPSEAQVDLCRDLWIHTYREIPEAAWESRVRGLSRRELTSLIERLYRQVGHHSDYVGPAAGTDEYDRLSAVGRQWADRQMIPERSEP